MKRWGLAALVLVAAIGGTAFAVAQSTRTANVEVRVWEDVNDPLRNFISARPEGGSWRTLGTIPLPLDDGVSSSGRFRYGDITVAVPLSGDAPTSTPTPTPTPVPTARPVPTPSDTRPVIHHDNGGFIWGRSGVRWVARRLDDGTMFTAIDVGDGSVDPAILRVSCIKGELDVRLRTNDYLLVRNEEIYAGRVTFKIGRNSERSQRWSNASSYYELRPSLYASDPAGLISEMKRERSILFYGARNREFFRASSFSIGGLLNTPVQWNIDHCGEY